MYVILYIYDIEVEFNEKLIKCKQKYFEFYSIFPRKGFNRGTIFKRISFSYRRKQ